MIININFVQRKKIQDMTIDVMDDDSDDDVKSVNKLITSLKVRLLMITINTFFPILLMLPIIETVYYVIILYKLLVDYSYSRRII